MQKFFVSLLFVLVLAIAVFSHGQGSSKLPKAARLPDGTVIAIPNPAHDKLNRVDSDDAWIVWRDGKQEFITGEHQLSTGDILLGWIGAFTNFPDNPGGIAKGNRNYTNVFEYNVRFEVAVVVWMVLDENDAVQSAFVVLILEDGTGVAAPLQQKENVQEGNFGFEPVFTNNRFTGIRAYVLHDGKRIAERVFKLPEVAQPKKD